MSQGKAKGSFTGVGLGATAAVALVICCAAPALLAGGLVASLGAFVGNPLVIALGVALVTGGVVFAVVHQRRRACCPPERGPVQTSADEVVRPRPPLGTSAEMERVKSELDHLAARAGTLRPEDGGEETAVT